MISRRRLDIQGLRALAVLMVVAFHAGLPVPGGFVGVDVFFVISGFVITGMLHREWLETGTLRFRRFYARRFKRLTPALALTVSVTLLLALALMSPLGAQQTAAQTGIGAMLLVANIVIARTTGGYFDAAAETNPLLNTWSLSVEEQFYLVFPVILLAGWLAARRFRRPWPLLIVGLVSVASLGIALASTRGPVPGIPADLAGFYGPLSRAWEFGAGALLALWLAGADRRPPRLWTATVASALGLVLILASLWLLSAATPGPGVRNLIPVTGSVLLLWGGQAAHGPVTRLLSARPLVSLGDVSYSWYLWHWSLIVFTALLWPGVSWAVLLAAGISLAPALASYRWVEQPIRHRVISSTPAWTRLITLTVLPPLVLGAALLLLSSQGYWSSTVRAYQAARAPHVDTVRGCVAVPAEAATPPDHCVWNRAAPGAPIYLLGDSNAGHFSEAVIDAGAALNRPVHIFAVHGCPFFDVTPYAETSEDPGDCARYVEQTMAWLETQPLGTVLLASSSTPWAPRAEMSEGEGQALAPTDAFLERALASTVRTVQSDGHEVMLLQVLPHFSSEPFLLDYERCSTWELAGGVCGQTMPRGTADDLQARTLTSYRQAALATGAPLIDVRPTLCPENACRTTLAGEPLYLNGSHISVSASHLLAPEMTNALRASRFSASGTSVAAD